MWNRTDVQLCSFADLRGPFLRIHYTVLYGGSLAGPEHRPGRTLPAWSPICISLTPITPLASPCSAACPHCERKTTWIELGGGWWSIPFACMLLSSSSSWSWCWTSNAKAWVRSFAKLYMLYVSDWDTKDDEEKMAERIELWNKVKPFYLPASPYNHRGFSSFSSFNLMWDPPPPHSLPFSHSQEKCQLSNDKGTLVVYV